MNLRGRWEEKADPQKKEYSLQATDVACCHHSGTPNGRMPWSFGYRGCDHTATLAAAES